MKLLRADSWSNFIEPVVVGGVPVAPLTTQQWVELMVSDCKAVRAGTEKVKYHTAVNGNVLSQFARRGDVRETILRADAVAADGVSILWGARRFARREIPSRAATTDLFHDLARTAEREGFSMYFLGATEEENAAALANVRKSYPLLKIAGARSGYFTKAEEADVVQQIIDSRPDILWVALGMPREDLFVARHLDKFERIGWVKTCGGLFNFLSGLRSRAPQWMQQAGLEWAYRTLLEPRRLFWRYFTTNIHAIWLMATRSRPR